MLIKTKPVIMVAKYKKLGLFLRTYSFWSAVMIFLIMSFCALLEIIKAAIAHDATMILQIVSIHSLLIVAIILMAHTYFTDPRRVKEVLSPNVEDERGNAVAHSDLLGGSFLFGQNPLPEARIIIHCFPSPVGYGKVSKESAAIHGSLNSSCSLIDYTRVDKPLNLGHLQAQIESSHSAPEVRPDKTFFCFGDGLYDFLFGEPVGSLLPFLLDHTPDTNGNMHYADGKKWDSEKSEKISVFFLFAPNWKEIENCAGNESYVSVPRGRFYEVYESLWVEHFLSPNV